MLATAGRVVPIGSRLLRPAVMNPALMLRPVSVIDNPQFDPISAHKAFKETADHSTMFKIEKYFSAAMVPLLPTAYFIHGPTMDTILAAAITLHVHWGLHGVLSDYGRPFVLGPTLAKIVQGPVSYLLSICLLAGLLHFNTYDVGITKAFEMLLAAVRVLLFQQQIQLEINFQQQQCPFGMLVALYLLGSEICSRIEPILHWHLQAAAVALFLYASIISPFFGLFVFVVISFSPFFLFAWLYLLWFYFDYRTPETGGRVNIAARNWKLYRYIADYFPVTLVKTADLPADHNYIIGAHPHGVFSFGSFITYTTNATGFDEKFPGIRCALATLRAMFWTPFKREEALYMTGLLSVSAESINYYLKEENSGKAIAIVVGGAEELLNAHPNNYNVCIANRKGFIRLAIKNGAYLVPSYCFGENNLYSQLPNKPGSLTRKLQNLIKSFIGFSPSLISGRGIYFPYFGLMPRRSPVYCVVGKPIPVIKNMSPNCEDVDKLHKLYCDQLCKLFEDYKLKCGANECDHINIC